MLAKVELFFFFSHNLERWVLNRNLQHNLYLGSMSLIQTEKIENRDSRLECGACPKATHDILLIHPNRPLWTILPQALDGESSLHMTTCTRQVAITIWENSGKTKQNKKQSVVGISLSVRRFLNVSIPYSYWASSRASSICKPTSHPWTLVLQSSPRTGLFWLQFLLVHLVNCLLFGHSKWHFPERWLTSFFPHLTHI